MKVLVTGGAGFIGSHLVDLLLEEGFQVRILDDLSSGSIDFLNPKAEFIHGSICDQNLTNKACKGIDYVFHLAAIASIPISIKYPEKCIEVNELGTINLVRSSMNNNVKKIIFSSTSAIYAGKEKEFVDEDYDKEIISIYAMSKYAGEHVLSSFNELYSLDSVSLRYFNVYGERQRPESEYSSVIPAFIDRAIRDEPLIIYGDGTQSRDFIHVKDVARANLASIHAPSGVYNIGSGQETTINSLAKEVRKLVNSTSSIVNEVDRFGDIKYSLCNNSKAIKNLNWEPKMNLSKGLYETFQWYSKYINEKNTK
tara:strand:- start:1688 stop:2620 length:933 start_codon:yes stop_codon:yes gene_type:complete